VRWQIRGAADLDGDGRPDLLWHHQQTGALYAWFMNGLVVKSAAYLSPPSVGDTQWQVRALADLDGDGRPDLLWHHQGTGELYAWFLDGIITRDASYLTPSRFADTRWKIVQASDFDQDGQVDLLWHHQATGELYVWFLDHKVVKGGAYLTPSAFADVSWKVVPR
jgi:hypothetical protein